MASIFVIEKEDATLRGDADGPFFFTSLGAAKDYLRHTGRKGTPRVATGAERGTGKVMNVRPYAGLADQSEDGLVDDGLVVVHENFADRKFAVSSRAANEAEFIVEVSGALAALADVGETKRSVRFREFLPLIVDMCCKYRGYKTERVQESVIFIAGDLQMPNLATPKVEESRAD